MALKYRLGLDVGTASVGAAAVSLDKDGQPTALVWHHVRIFSEPLENAKGTLVSKKAGRRQARMQRRQIDRRASRLRRIANLASLLGLKREEIAPDDGSNLPRLRAQAASQRVELEDLLRIFLRLSKRRGYKGEFKAKKKGEVAQGSSELSDAMRDLATEKGIALNDETDAGVTLGQYLLHRMECGLPTKLKVKEPDGQSKLTKEAGSNAPRNFYALRKMVEHEFDAIWKIQAEHHDILKATHEGRLIRDYFHEALFYQRPLKSAADLVAQCSLEPTLSRAPRAQMAFQRFRIEKTLADLRWGAGKRAEPLTPRQKLTIRQLLDQNDKVKFNAVYEELEKSDCAKPQGKGLNLDRASREELLGNATLSVLRKLDRHSEKNHPDRATNIEKTFRALDDKTQISIINFLADLGSPEQLDDPAWHNSFAKGDGKLRQFSESLITFVNRIKEHDNFDRLVKMGFDGGRASYSVKALNKLAEWLEEPNWPGNWQGDMSHLDEEAAIRVCYPQSLNREIKRMEKLPPPESTGNAVVDGSLRQIRWTVNKMINELGAAPSEIVVEMARDMSLGIMRRNERESDNTKQQKARREAESEIRKHGQTPTPSKIRRYLLWVEQDANFCPYCNKKINLADALSGSATEYEHIIPKSLSQVGMKRSEIVLAHHACNQEKGDLTPYERWGNTDRWQSVEVAAARFEAKKYYRKAKLLRIKDFEREVLTDESVNGFADRQFHQTSWIAKDAAQWLECLCPNKVSVSRGELTAMLRRNWKLETVIPEVRMENDLPVLDNEGKPIAKGDFNKLKKYLEGHPVKGEDRKANPRLDFNQRPDKRLDHRHHFIDALTLALTSRGLFQQMARNYKTAAERMPMRNGETQEEREKRMRYETRLRLEVPEPPLRNVREAALVAVRECRISIKPDRRPDGRLFQDFAYRVCYMEGDEAARLTRRKAIADLAGDSVGQTLKNINDIVSIEVRKVVRVTFENRIADKVKYPTSKNALSEPITHPQFGTNISKAHCFQKIGRGYISTDGSITVPYFSREKTHEKRLLHDGYACLEINLNDGKFESARSVRKQELKKRSFLDARRDLILYFKEDTLVDNTNGQRYRIRQINDGGKLVIAPISETLGVADMSSEYDLRRPSGKSLLDFTLVEDV